MTLKIIIAVLLVSVLIYLAIEIKKPSNPNGIAPNKEAALEIAQKYFANDPTITIDTSKTIEK